MTDKETPINLVPLAHPERLGLPFSRKTLSRKIATGEFEVVVKFGEGSRTRLFSTLEYVERYKRQLFELGLAAMEASR